MCYVLLASPNSDDRFMYGEDGKARYEDPLQGKAEMAKDAGGAAAAEEVIAKAHDDSRMA